MRYKIIHRMKKFQTRRKEEMGSRRKEEKAR